MHPEDVTPLERLEALSRDVERLATDLAVSAKGLGGEVGARARIEGVERRLRIALDELGGYPFRTDDPSATITDE
ncbi:MAG TPA: hypothetical protein VE591_08750 [Candidatus Acidoferrum sp.]|nr:hypothetical protein [Candidatus Acidoferrum sp.]